MRATVAPLSVLPPLSLLANTNRVKHKHIYFAMNHPRSMQRPSSANILALGGICDGSEVVELRAVRQTRKVLYMGPVPASLPACNSVLTRPHQTRR